MTTCDVLASGAIELYFYGESSPTERAALQGHLAACAACRQALDDLHVIRAALATRPDVSAPEGGDWTAFMANLQENLRAELPRHAVVTRVRRRTHNPYTGVLALAALLAIVTFSVLFVARTRHVPGGEITASNKIAGATTPAVVSGSAPTTAPTLAKGNAAFAAVSEQHLERSKLVVLGLATKDPHDMSSRDWAYERQLAGSLLRDTRLYRLAAEQRGLTSLAHVMGDLELVLLQTSMSEDPDPATLEQLQRLIRKRDLVTKMEVVTTGL